MNTETFLPMVHPVLTDGAMVIILPTQTVLMQSYSIKIKFTLLFYHFIYAYVIMSFSYLYKMFNLQ